jgi:MoxR-vWA-beta-propeller ternary system domain bpX6
MASVKPRSVVHRGKIQANGFFFAFSITTEREAIGRILSAWEPNARVYRFKEGFVLVLPRPVLVFAGETIGLPLIRSKGFLTGVPLKEKEIRSIIQPFESLVLSAGGSISTELLSDESLEAAHRWIDTHGLEFVQGTSLGTEPLGPIVAKPLELPKIRETLGRIPEAPRELKSLLARLKGEPESNKRNRFGWLRSFSFRSIAGAAQGLVRGLRSLWPRNAYEAQSLIGSQQSVFATRAPSKLSLWLASAFNKIVMVTRLARVLGWRQGRYLSRVMQMFEQGDMDEALRHGIPLSSISDSPILRMTFGLPGARQNLRLNPFGRRPTSAMVLGQSLYSHLHQLYRSTFKRLEAQGRIGEAAFVLAELLRANEEAVAFLERNGRLREAAEIAEARALAPEIIVRQWFLAGEKERAIQVARKTGAFHGAVLRLEKSRHPAASELRKLWAQSLADAGNVAVAVDVLWPLESERSTAVEWMRQAAAIGGRPGARSVARLISVAQDGYREFWPQALELLQSGSVEGAPARMEFAETLRKEPKSPQTQTLARLAARAVLRDAGQGMHSLGPIPMRQLIDYSGDGALRADIPPRSQGRKVELNDLGASRRYFIGANDRGSAQISDAVLLPSGSCAVAMGEVGLKLFTRDGRTKAHFDEPADRIVVSENGSKIITMGRRGAVWSLSRVDVLSRKATPWCHAEISGFATNFDGATWYVVCGQDLYAIDATSPRLDALWRIPDLGHSVGPLTLASGKLHLVTYKDKNLWLWEYQLPQLRLKSKTLLPFSRPLETVREIRLVSCSEGGVLDCSTVLAPQAATGSETQSTSACQLLFRKTNGSWTEFLTLGADEQVLGDPVVTTNWLALCLSSRASTRILLYRYAKGTKPALRIEIGIEGRCNPSVRFDGSLVTIADDLGHLRAYELTYGEQIRELNI